MTPETYQPTLALTGLYHVVVLDGKRYGADPEMHHLQKVNGVWCIRASVDQGAAFVGFRAKQSLGGCPIELTPDQELEMAKWVRDKCMDFAEECRVKFRCGNRVANHRRKKKRGRNRR